ncbi:MAG: TIGR03617 family F420-dependent LLM class oxidoreductase [Acidimicrobiales bacterium]
MKLDARLRNGMTHAIADARAAEEAGFDGAWTTENQHDPFLPLALAAEHTTTLDLGTSVAIAFARAPMTVAVQANDLHRFSDGRLHLGLGSQIRPHITKRFSMPWSRPADRMREFVLALRAIWATWNDGVPLRFEGEFYTHTLMIPAFSPPPNPHGPPRVVLAAVGPRMTEVCGEVADGIQAHPFTTERYLREVTLPLLEAGRAKAGLTLDGFSVGTSVFVALDEAAVAGIRKQIAFYGSTPAYRPVLDLHGWGDLHGEWNALSKQGRWDDMADLVSDDLLDAMAVVGSPAEVAAELYRRFDGVVDRLRFNVPGDTPSPAAFAELVSAMRR